MKRDLSDINEKRRKPKRINKLYTINPVYCTVDVVVLSNKFEVHGDKKALNKK
jgi:hypothetical protein